MKVFKTGSMSMSPSNKLGLDDRIIQAMDVEYNPPISTNSKYVQVETMDAISCDNCGKIHLLDVPEGEDDMELRFFTIQGNLHANYRGGILGNASWDKYGIPTFHYCKNCFVSYIKGLE